MLGVLQQKSDLQRFKKKHKKNNLVPGASAESRLPHDFLPQLWFFGCKMVQIFGRWSLVRSRRGLINHQCAPRISYWDKGWNFCPQESPMIFVVLITESTLEWQSQSSCDISNFGAKLTHSQHGECLGHPQDSGGTKTLAVYPWKLGGVFQSKPEERISWESKDGQGALLFPERGLFPAL